MIPQKAVNDVQGTYNVYVVKDDDSVDVRTVEIGETYGSDWIIKKGLSKGERVIVEGFQLEGSAQALMLVRVRVRRKP